VLTLGIDLAAADERTALAAISWSPGAATLQALQHGVTDDHLVEAIPEADKVGIDCPLGWPAKFVDFVVAQQHGSLLARCDGRYRRACGSIDGRGLLVR
jgi:predicted nuclease with RNAse H fold